MLLLCVCDRVVFFTDFVVAFIFVSSTIFIHLIIFLSKFFCYFTFLTYMTCPVECTTLNIGIQLFLVDIETKVDILFVIRVIFFDLLLLYKTSWALWVWLLEQILILLSHFFNFKHVFDIFLFCSLRSKRNTSFFALSLDLFT